MKAIRRRVMALLPLLILASGLQAAVLKEAVLSVKGMVCPA
jgi:hypothetical protein